MRGVPYPRLLVVALVFWAAHAPAADPPILSLHFAQDQPGVRLVNGARRADGALEFTHALQYAEVPFSGKLDGIPAITVGAWVCPKRSGEQSFFFRSRSVHCPSGLAMRYGPVSAQPAPQFLG